MSVNIINIYFSKTHNDPLNISLRIASEVFFVSSLIIPAFFISELRNSLIIYQRNKKKIVINYPEIKEKKEDLVINIAEMKEIKEEIVANIPELYEKKEEIVTNNEAIKERKIITSLFPTNLSITTFFIVFFDYRILIG